MLPRGCGILLEIYRWSDVSPAEVGGMLTAKCFLSFHMWIYIYLSHPLTGRQEIGGSGLRELVTIEFYRIQVFLYNGV